MTTAHPRSARKTPRRRRGSAHRPGPEPRSTARQARSAVRREAILAAALDEFSSRGFEAARLDDVAKRAGVAKGTIYLYFRDKEALFQELIRSVIGPLIARFEASAAIDLPARVIAERIVDMFVREVYGTRRKDVIRLIIAEGPRFPKLAEFYYREVIARIIVVVRGLLRRAA
ncbi:MAG TPA: TetR/AcrR family transcriptional regulator, partial [Pseudolabrys sp.]